jgi:hypothetical protein
MTFLQLLTCTFKTISGFSIIRNSVPTLSAKILHGGGVIIASKYCESNTKKEKYENSFPSTLLFFYYYLYTNSTLQMAIQMFWYLRQVHPQALPAINLDKKSLGFGLMGVLK